MHIWKGVDSLTDCSCACEGLSGHSSSSLRWVERRFSEGKLSRRQYLCPSLVSAMRLLILQLVVCFLQALFGNCQNVVRYKHHNMEIFKHRKQTERCRN